MPLALILNVLAFVLLLLAAFNVGAPKVSLGWLGLACFVLASLIGAR